MTKINTTDADYWTLAHEIYDDEYLKLGKTFHTSDSLKNPSQDIKENHNWITITSINDPNSDLQAAMVIPADEYDAVVNHNQQPSQAIFVARGTTSGRDWETNATELATGPTPQTIDKNSKKMPDNQFVQYDHFVDACIKKYKPKEYSFTGHSLGGAHTMRQGVRHNAKAVAFAGANSYRTLTEKQKKDVKAGKYDNKIINYRHYGDLVPNVPFDSKDGGQTIGKQQFVDSERMNLSFLTQNSVAMGPSGLALAGGVAVLNELSQHISSAWGPGIFNTDGSIKKISSKFESFMPNSFEDFQNGLTQILSSEGGSSSDKIKISPEDVNILASLLINIVENEIATFVSQTNANAKTEFEDNYNFKKIARYIAPDLSDGEIDDCLFDAGVTYQSMVEAPTESIKKKTKKMTEGGNELEEISDKTKNASSQFTNTDIQIGSQFS